MEQDANQAWAMSEEDGARYDVWVLAPTLELRPDDPLAALNKFEALRYARANLLVQQPCAAERWYHLDHPAEVAARNERFRRNNDRFGGAFSPQQHWLYSYDGDKAAEGIDDEWRVVMGAQRP